MITTQQIEDLILEKLEADGAYVVELTVNPGNKIVVIIDSEKGVPISYCVEISRLIEHNLDREVEDFSLEVASAGLGQPFKVLRQYHKNVGRLVEVLSNDGEKFEGKLIAVTDNEFSIEIEKKVKVEGKKKKELQVSTHTFKYEGVKFVKDIISF
ncbi:ribosome assembly cofactor RimP [Marinilabiliaceae bacterium JC017]|nr:ribosome assembly cofactor RimP [Marinilabiliaceae bacterium JC017]